MYDTVIHKQIVRFNGSVEIVYSLNCKGELKLLLLVNNATLAKS